MCLWILGINIYWIKKLLSILIWLSINLTFKIMKRKKPQIQKMHDKKKHQREEAQKKIDGYWWYERWIIFYCALWILLNENIDMRLLLCITDWSFYRVLFVVITDICIVLWCRCIGGMTHKYTNRFNTCLRPFSCIYKQFKYAHVYIRIRQKNAKKNVEWDWVDVIARCNAHKQS